MKTIDKLNAIKDATIECYQAGSDHDNICGYVLPLALENGIGFGEISALVRNIGETNGFITKLSDRKESAKKEIGEMMALPPEYGVLIVAIITLHVSHNVPQPFITNLFKGEYTKRGLTMPKKSEILDWQKAMVDCFIENPGMSKLDVHDCVAEFKKETSIPKSMLPMLQYMHKQLTNV